ncbi:uncharacterized protein LOC133779082 [Humulus lupulus]|uniref:uncharacterized protein LOC133779082 n=1 Tax=Humulus lupulus TaxID=3486 RepID=UPI002B40958F|nr:uncharacterized protein LOC133779082 [Humulus lupulus]
MAYGFELVYEHFRKQAPPSFVGKVDPVVAHDLLKSVDAIFYHMEWNDHHSISCAGHLLKLDTRIWWDVVKQTRDLNTMNWAKFVHEFSKKYYSATMLATKVDKFVILVKGNLSVSDYAYKLDSLARFVPQIVATEAMEVQRFMRGPN